MRQFLVMALLGAVLSLSLSFGLMTFVFAVIVALLPALAWRSLPALSGALVGWGSVWAVLIGSNYVRCVSMGPNCGGSEGILGFASIGAVVLLTGFAIAWLALRRQSRPPEPPPRS